MVEMVNRVVLVGHCGPDTFMLRAAVERAAPNAQVVDALSDQDITENAGPGSLMLVNRVLDGRFSDSDGIALIASLVDGGTPAMLISNFEDAQERAEQAGALPGFGKRDLNTDHATQRISTALEGSHR